MPSNDHEAAACVSFTTKLASRRLLLWRSPTSISIAVARACVGKEVTDLYLSESSARIANIDGSATALLVGVTISTREQRSYEEYTPEATRHAVAGSPVVFRS